MDTSSSRKHFQVINASDFRLPGGTSHSIAQEVQVQSRAGIRTALLHINSPLMRRPLAWSAPMQATVALPNVEVLTPADAAHTELLVIRHPSTLKDINKLLPEVTCEKLIVLANHAATDRDGTENYNPPDITKSLRDKFRVEPEWRPIGPVVRETIESYSDAISIGPDWVNIFSGISSPTPRTALHSPVTIGRHSRPQPSKWPDRAADIRAAYPMDTEFDVRILGGASAAEAVLSKRPSRWTVYEFGSVDPSEYLQEIDFWVYFHHPHTIEAYGRAAMEALHSGCVLILPEYMEKTFGDSALYGKPSDVKSLVREYSADPEKFLAQSHRGQRFADSLGPTLHLKRLEELGVSFEGPQPAIVSRQDAGDNGDSPPNPRTLFITSNGAGMGHLTRTLAIARAAREKGADGSFFSLSQGVPVVHEDGFPFEYMGSSAAMQLPASEWNDLFIPRLQDVLNRVQPDALVFDGTVPYTGLIKVLQDVDIHRVWVRRGMWRSSSPAKSLRREVYFDQVIEPGEYAGAYDEGPTKRHPTAELVSPITLLERGEVLNRNDARHALGINPESKAILVTLGAGNINSISDIQETILAYVAAQHSDWKVFITRPPISESIGESSLNILRTYPLARVANAFDFAVSAAGYNSFHEWLSMRIPTLWVPNLATSIDDQAARARWAHDAGVGFALDLRDTGEAAETQLKLGIDRLTDDEVRRQMRKRMDNLVEPNGAHAAASLILKEIAG